MGGIAAQGARQEEAEQDKLNEKEDRIRHWKTTMFKSAVKIQSVWRDFAGRCSSS